METQVENKLVKSKRVSAKEAAINAKTYYESLADAGQRRVTLEEVDLSDDGKYWLITLGIYEPTTAMALISLGLKESLNYKQFKVDATTGEVLSMKIRQIQFPVAPQS